MFDAALRRLIDPALDRAGRTFAARGVGADGVTVAGFATGLAAALAIALGQPLAGLALIACNRVADGLDGAIARVHGRTDRGGFLDIVLDFAFYGAVPLAFAVADPARNALAAAALLTSFYVSGAAFLAFAVMAERRGLETTRQGLKSLYYLGGLAEGGETIVVFVAFCLLPGWFPAIAWTFAGVTAVSAAARLVLGAGALRDVSPS